MPGMAGPVIVCPLCRSDDVEILANIPAIVLLQMPQMHNRVHHHAPDNAVYVLKNRTDHYR
jgi:hypothetical protein